MNNVLSENGFGNGANTKSFLENRVEALKALATLLLREVESLKPVAEVGELKKTVDKINLSSEVHRFEEALIRDALIRAGGQQRKAARLLGTKISTLNAKIKRYGIDPYTTMLGRK